MERKGALPLTAAICILIAALSQAAHAQYGGGTGEPSDPYLICTAEQMNAIGADPNDWDKHFKLMADLDLSAYAGNAFNLIGSDAFVHDPRRSLRQTLGSAAPASFTGVFDGNGHTIANLNHTGHDEGCTGLFRCIHDPNAVVRDLGLISPRIDSAFGHHVGSLVGYLSGGAIKNCYATEARVSGQNSVGGLVGYSGPNWGDDESRLTNCHASGVVTGYDGVGGLVGRGDTIAGCYAHVVVTGLDHVGGLVGEAGAIVNSYADAIVRGHDHVGGLAGGAETIMNCYAQGTVIGNEYVGGLVGYNPHGSDSSITNCYATASVTGFSREGGLVGRELLSNWVYENVVASFWDMETTGQSLSAGGKGKSTAQMQTLGTFLAWGEGDNAGVWTIDEGNDYPRLAWENRPGMVIGRTDFADLFAGAGTEDDPYRIYTPAQLDLIDQFPDELDKHYVLMADIDLGDYEDGEFHAIGGRRDNPFKGAFDGNHYTISNFTHVSRNQYSCGLFGYVSGESAEVRNLGLIGSDSYVTGGACAGALAGVVERATIANCYVAAGTVSGWAQTGGLVGWNDGGTIRECFSNAVVLADAFSYPGVGGLVGGSAGGSIRNCYATGLVVGDFSVGGLVGSCEDSTVTNSYATGRIVGAQDTGGLVGSAECAVDASFWDTLTTEQMESAGGTGLTTAGMMTTAPFLEAGWDFVGEDENGTEEIWWIDEGLGYPRLWWEAADAEF